MSKLLKYITNIEGVTAKQLSDTTGLPIKQVRAELVELHKVGKLARWRAPIGESDRWWRWEQRPLTDHTIMLLLTLALHENKPDKKLREILQLGIKRGQFRSLRDTLAILIKAVNLREMVEDAIRFYRETHGFIPKSEVSNATLH